MVGSSSENKAKKYRQLVPYIGYSCLFGKKFTALSPFRSFSYDTDANCLSNPLRRISIRL
ncbi:MAG: hypothetical protein PWQ17_982 [Anaerophaga sp.]|nr:hypothetical protein [Anaerophaga sp.]